MMITGVSNRRFAELDGCTEGRVRTGRKRGELPVLADGTLDPRLAGTGWRARNETAVAPEIQVSPGSLADERRRQQIALARVRRQQWLGQSAKFVTAEEAEAVRAAAVAAGLSVRSIISGLASKVAECARFGEIRAAIRDAVHAWLQAASQAEGVATVPAAAPPLPIPATISKLEAEKFKTAALADLRGLDFDISIGAVVGVQEVERVIGGAMMQLRSRLLALEARLPPVLLGLPADDAQPIIARAIEEAVQELPLEPIWPAPPVPPPAAATANRASR